MVATAELLTPDECVGYLRDAGLVAGSVTARPLSGGVSNIVLLAEAPDARLVVKQALPRLRVADLWEAKQERTLTEAAALKVAGRLTPDLVPTVVHVDPERCILVIDAAPSGCAEWKQQLLAGRVEPSVAARLGETLATWHAETAANPALARTCDDAEAFRQLRIDPYHRTVQERHPELGEQLEPLITELASRRDCLVHGDFSPKNVLTGPDLLWVVDFEVAHIGTPAFDTAFLLCHLLLKTVHRPDDAKGFESAAREFWDAYETTVAGAVMTTLPDVTRHVAALLLARVDGKSPAEYLTVDERAQVWALGIRLLADPAQDVADMWSRVAESG
jgi:5-methylthioribose kinase